jgi:16S rRNA (cytidine1402-2'-O)-methyltransferase
MATFYVVATPIGNLEDMTLRAIRILREASLVVCEDTRVTKKLLQKYDISTPTLSYPADAAKPGWPSFESKVEKIFSLLEEGKDVALVTDAGTPALSDPGFIQARLPRRCQLPVYHHQIFFFSASCRIRKAGKRFSRKLSHRIAR